MPSPEEIQRYLAATTQNYPKFGAGGIPVNADAFASALQGFPESTNIEDRRDELGGFDAAAARTRQSVRPQGGRQEGALSRGIDQLLPTLGAIEAGKVASYPQAAAGMLSSLASLPQRATQAAAMLQQQGDVYDPAPAVEAAMLPMGGTFAGAPAGAMGAGIVKPIRAYHGSPHDFDRFDLSKIGTGEGAQAYGHGLYFAENPEVAEAYRKASQSWAQIMGRSRAKPAPGRMYEVNINAAPEQFLDWDKQLTAQPQAVQELISKIPQIARQQRFQTEFLAPEKGMTGSGIYRAASQEFPNVASETMREAGIPGIKYLDQGSRGQQNFVARHPQGGTFEYPSEAEAKAFVAKNPDFKLEMPKSSSNYVVFDDKLIDILKKYGLGGLGIFAGAKAASAPDSLQSLDRYNQQ